MLYRPKYCANCGETIERDHWTLLTSRRFCQVCESEYKGLDLVPRVVVGIGVIAGVLGLGSYLRSSSPPDNALLRPPRKLVEQAIPLAEAPVPAASNNRAAVNPGSNTITGPTEKRAAEQQPANARPVPPEIRTQVTEAQYYCGAETKKGTPCMRKVKGNKRCYQHQGMPAMAGADKLRIN